MKKYFKYFTLFLLLSPFLAKAQTETNSAAINNFNRVEFGLRLMPTISSFSLESDSGNTIKGEATFGFGFGAILGFNITRHVGISGEVLYNALSQKYVDKNLNRTIKLRYVNFPILLSLNTGKDNPVNLKVEFGPQFGYNLGYSHSSSGDANTDTIQTVFASKKGDFGFAYGTGLGFKLNKNESLRFDLGYRGVYGFSNIVDTDASNGSGTTVILRRAKVRTHSIYIGFAVIF